LILISIVAIGFNAIHVFQEFLFFSPVHSGSLRFTPIQSNFGGILQALSSGLAWNGKAKGCEKQAFISKINPELGENFVRFANPEGIESLSPALRGERATLGGRKESIATLKGLYHIFKCLEMQPFQGCETVLGRPQGRPSLGIGPTLG
jgi:hypothetical protein